MRVQSSFRDPSGQVFTKDGMIFRQVNLVYKEHYDHLMTSGLYDALVRSELLIGHEEIDVDCRGSDGIYKILKPQVIRFISYPYEWCFSQLKDAALTTLQVQKKALGFGMPLKDSSAYNIQFLNGRPVFIDTLSFQKYEEGEPWVAYRQFCQHFHAPLALMSYRHVGLNQLLRSCIDGIPLDLAHSILPIRTRLNPSMQIHIHLHSKFQNKFADDVDIKPRHKGKLSLRSFLGLIDSLESAVKKLKWRPEGTEWVNYYEDDSYTPEALDSKIELVTEFLQAVRPGTLWDLGANTGLFSRLASDQDIETIAFDKDPAVVERNYLRSAGQTGPRFLPLLLDLTNPSPRIGWANVERMDLLERGPADMLLALALVHHLAISENVPLGMIAEFFRKLGSWAIIEFVPKSDKKVAHLLKTREDIFTKYTQEDFEDEFKAFFEIESVKPVADSARTLYLMRGK